MEGERLHGQRDGDCFARAPSCSSPSASRRRFPPPASLPLSAPVQQAFNATAVVRHMRRLQLGTSLEGPSQITPTSPCHGHLLPEEEEEEEDEDLGNGEEESCKSLINYTDGYRQPIP